jgi:hypothetical protein
VNEEKADLYDHNISAPALCSICAHDKIGEVLNYRSQNQHQEGCNESGLSACRLSMTTVATMLIAVVASSSLP